MALHDTYSTNHNSPIAIGGLGGSGTRVIADILSQAGVYIGDYLNASLDNLLFTLLFVHESYFKKSQAERDKVINQSLDIFCQMMQRKTFNVSSSMQLLAEAWQDCHRTNDYFGNWQYFINEITSTEDRQQGGIEVWGWKEPNTHIYLEYLINYFTSLRYIHVIRHGLDMAYSKNQNQCRRWGSLLGIENTDLPDISPQTSFEFWNVANQQAIHLARALPQNCFLLVNYDDLCNFPETGVSKILDFLGLHITNEVRQSLFELPSPVSMGRYRDHDLLWIDEKHKIALKNLGYSI